MTAIRQTLFDDLDVTHGGLPAGTVTFPQLRYMGSKWRLLPWLHDVLSELEFDTALDAFSGSGCVSYLLKSMGKRVWANDFLQFAQQITLATVENGRYRLNQAHIKTLTKSDTRTSDFAERTFGGVFFEPSDLRFIDDFWVNVRTMPTRYHQALALASLVRACVKKQPRGVFTVANSSGRYDDGRRDLHLPLVEQFAECVETYNKVVFDNGHANHSMRADILSGEFPRVDLVYLDPPYVPRADDNCYVKRYHFLEGLVSYWSTAETSIQEETKVKKIAKRYTPFSYRRTAVEAFDNLFARFRQSIIVLSYSSNGYPDLSILTSLMSRYKSRVTVREKAHRYHFGTHSGVNADRAQVTEYLIVGQ